SHGCWRRAYLKRVGIAESREPRMSDQAVTYRPPDAIGLYDPRDEHDACGVGFVVDVKGRRSHGVVRQGLQVLINLLHRGACGCEANTGDGAGILIQMPDRFLRKATASLGITLPPAGQYGSGLVFLPRGAAERGQCRELVERIIREEGARLLGWRAVPTTDAGIGASALAAKPVIEQVFIRAGEGQSGDGRLKPDTTYAGYKGTDATATGPTPFERKLYVIRKRVEHEADGLALAERHVFYMPSLSSQTLIYKGMLIADQIEATFPDLADPHVEPPLARVRHRSSTHPVPSRRLAHPHHS